MSVLVNCLLLLAVQRRSCTSPEVPPEGDDITDQSASLATPGGSAMSHLVHKATLLAVCIGAVTSLTCVIDTRVDVIISLPRLLTLRTFHCTLLTSK